jgi:uncharacterized alkaline shock family protein YloU
LKLIDKVFILVTSTITLALSVALFAIALGWNAGPPIAETLVTMYNRTWETVVVAGVLLLIAVHLAGLVLRRGEEKAVITETELGKIRISFRAIENLVCRTVRSIKGVRDLDVKVISRNSGVDIQIALIVEPETVFTELGDEVQQKVVQAVGDTGGITAGSVAVKIKAVASAARTRLE